MLVFVAGQTQAAYPGMTGLFFTTHPLLSMPHCLEHPALQPFNGCGQCSNVTLPPVVSILKGNIIQLSVTWPEAFFFIYFFW